MRQITRVFMVTAVNICKDILTAGLINFLNFAALNYNLNINQIECVLRYGLKLMEMCPMLL